MVWLNLIVHIYIYTFFYIYLQNNGAQQLASEATVYIMLEDVNDEIPLFTEREQETVLEGEPIGTKVTQVNAIDKDGTFPNNQVSTELEQIEWSPWMLIKGTDEKGMWQEIPGDCWQMKDYGRMANVSKEFR